MAAAHPPPTKVIDQSQVAPPPGSVSTATLPLTFFDLAWLFCCPVRRIFFYEFSCTSLHFTQTLLPRLKESLSLTLRHFFPFAANLTCPPLPNEPYILYNEGNGVQVTVIESDTDFNHLIANNARDVKTLQSLVPKLPPTRLSSKTTHVVPIMAIQFTVFPNSGICVGVTSNHVAADGRCINNFMKFWASIHRSQGEDYLTSLSLPYYNKDNIKDPHGVSSSFLKDLQRLEELNHVVDADSPDNVMITLVMKQAKVDQLKQYVATQNKNNEELKQIRISTYVVACAFMWVNLMKLQEQISGCLDDDTICHFLASADCRERFLTQLPGTYFGNCLTHIVVPVKRRELLGESGIFVAANAIGRKIYELGEGALKIAEEWLSNCKEVFKQGHVVTVASSPKFQVYETDFGFGRPKKFELVHMSAYSCFSLAENRENDGGLDIGVVVERHQMDIFNALFEQQSDIH